MKKKKERKKRKITLIAGAKRENYITFRYVILYPSDLNELKLTREFGII